MTQSGARPVWGTRPENISFILFLDGTNYSLCIFIISGSYIGLVHRYYVGHMLEHPRLICYSEYRIPPNLVCCSNLFLFPRSHTVAEPSSKRHQSSDSPVLPSTQITQWHANSARQWQFRSRVHTSPLSYNQLTWSRQCRHCWDSCVVTSG